MARTCSECGASWGGAARWCATCGHALVEVEATVGPTIDADDDRQRPEGRWRRWATGVGLLAVLVAGGVLASQQVVGQSAEDDVDGGIGLPESEPAEPERRRQPGPDQPPIDDAPGTQVTCTRDGAEVPDCPRLLRTGVEGWNAVGDVVLDGGLDHVEAIDLRTGRTRWRIDDFLGPFHQAVPAGEDLVLLGRDSLRRVGPDGEERWAVDVDNTLRGSPSLAGPRSNLVILQADGRIEARSMDDGLAVWSTAFPEDVRSTSAYLVGRTDDGVLVFAVSTGDGSTGTVAALDETTGDWSWILPTDPQRSSVVIAATDEIVVTQSYPVDGSTGDMSEGSTVVRDVRTGEPRWELDIDEDAGFGGTTLVDEGGLLVLTGDDTIQARDVLSGEVVWQADGGLLLHRMGAAGWAAGARDVPDHVPLVVLRQGRMDRLDPTTGGILWSAAVDRGVEWGVATDERLFLSTFRGSQTVAIHDPDQGAMRVRIELPSNESTDLQLLSFDPLAFLVSGRLLTVPDDVLERAAAP